MQTNGTNQPQAKTDPSCPVIWQAEDGQRLAASQSPICSSKPDADGVECGEHQTELAAAKNDQDLADVAPLAGVGRCDQNVR